MKLLKFSATWCGPCQELKKRLKDFTACEVIDYDVDDDCNDELVAKYKVTNIPVLVLLDDNENVIEKWVGLVSLDTINTAISKINN